MDGDGLKCRYCGATIYGSNGFLNAGDLHQHLLGKMEASAMRVTCGRCDAKTSFQEAEARMADAAFVKLRRE